MRDVGVVYVSRKVNDPRFTRAFLSSIARHPPGVDYQLFYVLKGFESDESDPAFEAARDQLPARTELLRYPDDTFTTNIFLDVSKLCSVDKLLSFVSWSRILADNWLRAYIDGFDAVNGCGIVGATGGYEGIKSAPFPNVGIRTNAYMVPTALLNAVDAGDLSTRRGSLEFEAGPNGLTKQIVRMGFKPVIVDRFGKHWLSDDWVASRTFRSYEQEGLLVADNRTFHYSAGGVRRRQKLARLTWGSDWMVSRPGFNQRIKSMIDWYYPEGMQDFAHALTPGRRGVVPR